MRVNISICKKDLELIDSYCRNTGLTRSVFLVRSAIFRLKEKKFKKEVNSPKEIKRHLKFKGNLRSENKDNPFPIGLCKHRYPSHLCKDSKCRHL